MEIIQLESKTAFQQAINTIHEPEKIIVCGAMIEIERLQENKKSLLENNGKDFDAILEQASLISAEEYLKKQETQNFIDNYNGDMADVIGEWLGEDKNKGDFALAHEVGTETPIKDLKGLRIQIDESWQLPAALGFGGWNACPEPEAHVSVWQYWQEKYGAYIVGMSSEIIEAHVKNPPRTKEEAIELAWEQTVYCADITDSCGGIANLAAFLLNHNQWYFWWD